MFLLGPRLYARQWRDSTGSELGGAARVAVYRRIWEQAALAIGATFSEGPPGYQRISRQGREARLWRQLVPLDDPVTLRLAGDKPAAHAVLEEADVPVAPYCAVDVGDLAGAEAFVRAHSPSVVKPASSTGAGRGVTPGVATRTDLLRARLAAARYDSERMLLERQASGDEHRILVLDGEPIGAVLRRPPVLIGDGSSTIAELVERENARRREARGCAGLFPLSLDLDALITLGGSGRSFRSVPGSGEAVTLKSATSQGSERDATVVPIADARIAGAVADAARAARAIGGLFLSVELVTPDPALPLHEAGGIVLEVNTTPGIAQHYLVSNPESIEPVAERVLDRLLTGGAAVPCR
jgi:cyanophycin synthetase